MRDEKHRASPSATKVRSFPYVWDDNLDIKAGLKVDRGTLTAISEGTPQGGVLSPLLANIALHGISKMLEDYIEKTTIRDENSPIELIVNLAKSNH